MSNSSNNFQTQIFLDSGNPQETEKVINLLGFLDGQTTNPSLVAKSPQVQEFLQNKTSITNADLLSAYQEVVQTIHQLIPQGSISIEVYADQESSYLDLLEQAEQMQQWIPSPHIKFPTTKAGLQAAAKFTENGGKTNMTLVFSLAQAYAVALATHSQSPQQVFVSPFIGRLEDEGYRGADLLTQIQDLYRQYDFQVNILAASLRTLSHLKFCLENNLDIVTMPYKMISDWAEQQFDLSSFEMPGEGLQPLSSKVSEVDSWEKLDISHYKTDEGLQKFANDWRKLLT
jgi:transaldolase